MEQLILISFLITVIVVLAVLYGVAKTNKKITEDNLKLGDKIDKIISSNSCIEQHEWINWLQERRSKQK